MWSFAVARIRLAAHCMWCSARRATACRFGRWQHWSDSRGRWSPPAPRTCAPTVGHRWAMIWSGWTRLWRGCAIECRSPPKGTIPIFVSLRRSDRSVRLGEQRTHTQNTHTKCAQSKLHQSAEFGKWSSNFMKNAQGKRLQTRKIKQN